MSLNQIQLPASVIANLYRHSLIEPDHSPESKTQKLVLEKSDTSGDKWKYLGENQKNILIVVDYKDAFYLPDEELSFLTNMLAACQLGLGDVAIINLNKYNEINYKDLVAQFSSRVLFLFGVDPVALGVPVGFPHFQVQSVAKTTLLFTPALEEVKKDALLKSKLWVALRRIFGI